MRVEALTERTGKLPGSIREPVPEGFPNTRHLFFLLLAYFSLQIVLRVWSSSTLDLDEAEQAILAQKYSWGYGVAPLYTWLQIPFFDVFGQTVLALSLFKNLLLLTNCLLTYAVARKITGRTQAGVAAALSLFFIPSVAWESQRDLTHTVLSATLAIATLLCLMLLRERRTLGSYLLFGLCVGLGILSKYNYVFWALGLGLAATCMSEFRPVVVDKRILLSFFAAAVVCLPNMLWIPYHRELAFLEVPKLEIQKSATWFEDVRSGLRQLCSSIFNFGGPLSLVYLLLFWNSSPGKTQPTESSAVCRKLLLRSWLVVLAILLGLVLFARASRFSERWFEPVLICLPIYLVILVNGRLDLRRLKILALLSLLVMLTVAVIMPGRLFLAERLKRDEMLARPYSELAEQIRPLVPGGSVIVCNTRELAGNLRLDIPQARVLCPELTTIFGSKGYHHCFLVWEPVPRNTSLEPKPPDRLRTWVLNYTDRKTDDLEPRIFTVPYKFYRNRQYSIGVLRVY